jgi:hypothetical protein
LTSNFLDLFNPLSHINPEEYVSLWQYLFSTFLQGFWARLIAFLSILFSFWFGVYRRRLGLGITFFVLSFIFTYLGGLIGVLFRWFK